MSDYFQHNYLSNSEINEFLRKVGAARELPENIDAIYSMGTLTHATIFEPHLADTTHDGYGLALKMRDTFWADPMCRAFASANDFEREKPYFHTRQVGPYIVNLRCKADGVRTRLGSMLEFKGLGVDTEKAFRHALVDFNYDKAVAHYMITGDFKMALIVGISKRDPRKLFKWLVKRHDEFYLGGEQKLIDSLDLLRQYSPEDVKLAA